MDASLVLMIQYTMKGKKMKSLQVVGWTLSAGIVVAGIVYLMFGLRDGASQNQVAEAPQSVKRVVRSQAKPRTQPIRRLQSMSKAAKPVSRDVKVKPITPDDITAFNAAVDSGLSVMDATEKIFADRGNTDGVIAALKLMSRSPDPKVRRGVYQAVGRLFTDEHDLTTAVATAQALLDAMPTLADDGSQSVSIGEASDDTGSERGEVVAEASPAQLPEADVVDDSEVKPDGDQAGEGDVQITDDVDPACDDVQGEEIQKLLRAGVADADRDVRQEALQTASQMENHFKYDAYGTVLEGADSELKQSVLGLCSGFGCEEDVAIQRQALKNADPAVAAAAQKNLDSAAAREFLEADAAAKAAVPVSDGK